MKPRRHPLATCGRILLAPLFPMILAGLHAEPQVTLSKTPADGSANAPVAAGVPVTVSFPGGSPGQDLPGSFAGLSYETFNLLPGTNGVRYFRPDNKPLLELFATLGIRNLRVGGNTGDRDFKAAPSETDIENLFEFAKLAGVKVIYCLRLLHADPAEQARIAKSIALKYPDQLGCFSIGQEPSAYPVEQVDSRRGDERMGAEHEHYPYAAYATNWKQASLEIRKAVPNAGFAGPGVHRNTEWPRNFLADFGKDGGVSLLTSHLYPGGPGGKVTNAVEGRDRMLSGEFEKSYLDLASLIPVAASNNIPFRLEEVNNYFNGGAANVSDTFAASLWGLDFLWWWAAHGAEGVNFHTGNSVAAGSVLTSCRYSAFYSLPGGVQVQPLGYGIKAFQLGARGRIVPVKISSARPVGLSAYATLDSNTLTVTLINREHGPAAAPLNVTLNVPNAAADADMIALTAPGGDVASKEGITIGGSPIASDGSWKGSWTQLKSTGKGRYDIRLPSVGAFILRVPVSAARPAATRPPPPPRTAEDAVTPKADPSHLSKHAGILAKIGQSGGQAGLVLIGDSITDFWPSKGTDSYAGLLPWKPLNLGFSGESTEQVLWRLQNGELDGYKARVVMILIGTNNLGHFLDEKPEWVAAGIGKIVATVREKQPDARILLLGILPRGATIGDPMRLRVAEVNKLLAPLADDGKVRFLDIGEKYLDPSGNIPKNLMPDFLHPNAEGYRVWFEAVKPTLDGWMS